LHGKVRLFKRNFKSNFLRSLVLSHSECRSSVDVTSGPNKRHVQLARAVILTKCQTHNLLLLLFLSSSLSLPLTPMITRARTHQTRAKSRLFRFFCFIRLPASRLSSKLLCYFSDSFVRWRHFAFEACNYSTLTTIQFQNRVVCAKRERERVHGESLLIPFETDQASIATNAFG
jgi:hypothetical protein